MKKLLKALFKKVDKFLLNEFVKEENQEEWSNRQW